jgi:hypothetical protein
MAPVNYIASVFTKHLHGNMTKKPYRIVIHTTEGRFDSDFEYLRENSREVGCHVYISPNGDAYQMAPWDSITWHCGAKAEERTTRPDLMKVWPLNGDENDGTIGIEVSAPWNKQMNAKQYKTLVEVIADLVQSFNIPLDRQHIVGHKELKSVKIDPPGLNMDAVVVAVKDLLNPIPPTFRYYPQFDQTVSGPFLEFFDKHGGVGMFGYPITAVESYPNKPQLKVQYFENVRLEWDGVSPVRAGAVVREYLKSQGRI